MIGVHESVQLSNPYSELEGLSDTNWDMHEDPAVSTGIVRKRYSSDESGGSGRSSCERKRMSFPFVDDYAYVRLLLDSFYSLSKREKLGIYEEVSKSVLQHFFEWIILIACNSGYKQTIAERYSSRVRSGSKLSENVGCFYRFVRDLCEKVQHTHFRTRSHFMT